ncbi:hypothetical protein PENTCL1PPCAC_21959 [Pristionchus entomophagus]|uniref:BTB domain-containing protein n=1 Tax=Pristionchus entomophagus TaxID=358040 RepID=A0AAV5U045_9BILA|nr:hypothetical protein PENTCL1PPCAC_21959 [Pristionchus entomophagus]
MRRFITILSFQTFLSTDSLIFFSYNVCFHNSSTQWESRGDSKTIVVSIRNRMQRSTVVNKCEFSALSWSAPSGGWSAPSALPVQRGMNKEVEFVWEIENVSKFDAEAHNSIDFNTFRESPVFFVAGIPWSLGMDTEINDGYQEVFIRMNCEHEDSIVPWNCKLTLLFIVKNQDPEKMMKHERTLRFDTYDQFWGKVSIITEFLELIKKALELDFTSPGVGSDYIALIVEGQKLHVSKNYLPMHSPVFAAMFFQEFRGDGKN